MLPIHSYIFRYSSSAIYFSIVANYSPFITIFGPGELRATILSTTPWSQGFRRYSSSLPWPGCYLTAAKRVRHALLSRPDISIFQLFNYTSNHLPLDISLQVIPKIFQNPNPEWRIPHHSQPVTSLREPCLGSLRRRVIPLIHLLNSPYTPLLLHRISLRGALPPPSHTRSLGAVLYEVLWLVNQGIDYIPNRNVARTARGLVNLPSSWSIVRWLLGPGFRMTLQSGDWLMRESIKEGGRSSCC